MFAKAFLSLRSVVFGAASGAASCAVVASLLAVGGVANAAAPDVVPVSGSRPVADRVVQPINDAARITLHGTVHPLATKANDRGAVPDGMKLERVQVLLKRSDAQESALKQLISDMHNPKSASYHQWLTPDSFGKQFGPSDADIAKVQGWLASHGFSVGKLNAGRQTLEFTGTAGQFRDTFKAPIHSFSVKGGTHFANSVDPQIPAALAPVFGGFASLNSFPLKSYSHILGKASYNPATHESKPDWTVGTSSALSLVLSPADYAVQYDLPSASSGNDGTGTSIAIINESNIDVPTADRFRTLFGLPANSPQVIIDGNDPGIDGNNNPDGPNGASGEAYLDVEWAGAVAPNATINLVIAADTVLENGLILAAERTVYSNISPIVSISFGNCEYFLGSENSFWNSLWEQAAAQGITVLASAGDSGSAGCDDANSQAFAVDGQQVSGIATTPFDVAVGGTDFYYTNYNGTQSALNSEISSYWNLTPSNVTPTVSLLRPVPEQPWNDSQFGLNFSSYFSSTGNTTIAAASGGASNCANATLDSNGDTTACIGGYPKPSWQTGTGVPADTVRDIPDVSLFASNGQNASFYPLCASSTDCQPSTTAVQFSGVGGTSASTPSFAGVMALINQKYGRQGQANYVLYPLAAQYPAAFHDVTVGTNTVPCNIQTVTYSGGTLTPFDCQSVPAAEALTGTIKGVGSSTEGEIAVNNAVAYNAGTGYDLASGLGTIDASVLINDWNKIAFNATTTTLTPSSTSFTHGTTIGISGAVTGSPTPTGDVALMTDSPLIANQGETAFTLDKTGAYAGSLAFLPGGTYNVWGSYGGDGSNAGSSSAKTQITVSPEASTTTLSAYSIGTTQYNTLASGGSIPSGTVVVLSAVPQSSAGTANDTAATGTIVFSDNGTVINTATLNTEGDAEYDVTFGAGSHSVTATYSGDASYNASSAGPITFTVTQAAAGITVSASSAITIAAPGNSGTSTISVTPTNGFTGSVALACAITTVPVGASEVPTCTLSPASVSFAAAATAAATSTLTVNTSAPTSANLALPMKTIFSMGGGVALAGLIFLGAGFGSRSRRAMKSLRTVRLLSAAAFFALIASAAIGCGGGTSSGGGGSTSGGTTPGTYVFTVTATPATGTAQTVQVSVTVN